MIQFDSYAICSLFIYWLIEASLGPPVPGPKGHGLCESVRHHRHGGGGSKRMAPQRPAVCWAIFGNQSVGLFFSCWVWESSLAGVYRLHEIFIEGVGARFLQQSFTRLRWFSVQCKHRQAYSTLIAWHWNLYTVWMSVATVGFTCARKARKAWKRRPMWAEIFEDPSWQYMPLAHSVTVVFFCSNFLKYIRWPPNILKYTVHC